MPGQLARMESGRERAHAQARMRRLGYRRDGVEIREDLAGLTSHVSQRDPTHRHYNSLARRVAGRLQEQGALPAGEGKAGLQRYLQPFQFQVRGGGTTTSTNVVGLQRGSGGTGETVVVMAHLDGLTRLQRGSSPAYQGANDNASGVAAALYVSDVLGRAARMGRKPLRRDVLFVFPSAEEQGIKGSAAVAAALRQQFPTRKIVGVINLEMVGRSADPRQVFMVGGDSAAAAAQNPVHAAALSLKLKGNMARPVADTRYWDASDHASFARQGIPSVMLSGLDFTGYHKAADTSAALDPQYNHAVARTVLRLVHKLAE